MRDTPDERSISLYFYTLFPDNRAFDLMFDKYFG